MESSPFARSASARSGFPGPRTVHDSSLGAGGGGVRARARVCRGGS